MKEVTDKKIQEALNIQLNRNKLFIDELATFIDGLQQLTDFENDDLDDQEGEEEDANVPHTGRIASITAYKQAVRAQARALASKKELRKNFSEREDY